MNEQLHYVLVQFGYSAGRMGSLQGHFITTYKKLDLIKKLPRTYFHDVLGKHSEVVIKWSEEGLLKVVSEDQAFIREAVRVFEVDDDTGHLLGFNPFKQVWDGEWEDDAESIPVPWIALAGPEPTEADVEALERVL